MRTLVLLSAALLIGCSDADRSPSAAPALPQVAPPAIRELAGPPIDPRVCVPNPDVALRERLRLAGLWNDDPVAGPMSPRMANNIPTHSDRSLRSAMARYRGRVAALVTHADHAESCAWLVDRSGIVAYSASSIGAEQIHRDVAAVIDALDVEGASALRAPIPRSAPQANRAPGSAPLPALQTEALAVALTHVAETITPAPIAARLRDYESIIIVPHQLIADFPFMLLAEGRAPGPTSYLVEHMSIQVAPSLAELGIGPGLHRDPQVELATMSAESRTAALSNALIVGDPLFNDAEYIMPQLAGAAAEARNVAEELGASFLSGQAATAAAVHERLNQRPRYVHFATHGLADFEGADENRGFLALASGGRLGLEEVRSARMANGAIVVLSACQSGLGARRPGGIVGLPRAFLNAGAQTAIMSLWNVDDAATSFLMVRFTENLRATGRPAAAFREATLATRDQFSDPRLWASFVVFGAGQP